MAVNISPQQEEDCLVIKTSGEIEGWIDLTKQIFEEITKFNYDKIILDLRNLNLPTGYIHYIDLVRFYAKNLPFEIRLWKVASVVDPAVQEAGTFWEIYCNNRGYPYKTFTYIEAAKAWINQSE